LAIAATLQSRGSLWFCLYSCIAALLNSIVHKSFTYWFSGQ
jgi:hypothetical protein